MYALFHAETSQLEALLFNGFRIKGFHTDKFHFSQRPLELTVPNRLLLIIGLCLIGFCVNMLSVASVSAADQQLNINTASPALLAERLPGIGPAKAKAIVLYREQNGPFKKLDALTAVKGIGPRTLEKIRSLLFVDLNETKQSSGAGSEVNNAIDQQSQLHQEKKARNAVRAAVNIARQFGSD